VVATAVVLLAVYLIKLALKALGEDILRFLPSPF
jgi:hypothetical protein